VQRHRLALGLGLALLWVAWASVAHATIATVTSGSASNTGSGSATTASLDTTGATLLVAVCMDASTTGVTDSKSNTWATAVVQTTSGNTLGIYYVKNPTVGTGHTFTCGSVVASISVAAFSGTDTTANVDQTNSHFQAGTATIQAGSITPSASNEIVIGAFGDADNHPPYSIDSSYTIYAHANYVAGLAFGSALAYLIQTSAAATNPTWTFAASGSPYSAIASFKAAAVATVPPHGRGRIE
jgi:hypothetical protein